MIQQSGVSQPPSRATQPSQAPNIPGRAHPIALILSVFDSSRFPNLGNPRFGCWLLAVGSVGFTSASSLYPVDVYIGFVVYCFYCICLFLLLLIIS